MGDLVGSAGFLDVQDVVADPVERGNPSRPNVSWLSVEDSLDFLSLICHQRMIAKEDDVDIR